MRELALFLDDQGQSSELVCREIHNGDLLQAASFGVSKLTPASFGTFIRGAVRFGSAHPHAIHKAIVELGPTSFITTNYDTLIEQALAIWRTDAFFPAPVTNKHLVELADIVRARSSHFIFKPHGDVSDVSSIVLTREQYRTLMPGGERHSALESLKTLLVTRPVLYVGFGLRDPDFMYLRDLLLNIYQGAVRDHWAIMPDVTDGDADYWRNQYGIKLLGYKSHEHADGSPDHRDLLPLLEKLAVPDATIPIKAVSDSDNSVGPREAEWVLALTRYTSGLVRRLAPTSSPIEVRISQLRTMRNGQWEFGLYENWTTTHFLIEGPQPAYLIGLPGSGKSFALRLAARQLATKLQQACIEDALSAIPLTLPILLDLKLYQGDLRAQIDGELPAGFTLNQLRSDLRLKVFLDAFNEMPSEYLENGTLFQSLDRLKEEIGEFDYVITSRTPDGLPERTGETTYYEINRFDRSHVDAVLAEHQIVLSGGFSDDIRDLLSRPFFLQLVAKGLVEVPANARPRDIFASFLTRLQLAFSKRFECDLPLLPIFAKVAYRAIETESEAFPFDWLSDLIATQLLDTQAIYASEVINWLVAREVLIPYSGRRAAFVHQSITEYCAATELARRTETKMVSLRDTIASKKWDQCLFLALALMNPESAKTVLDDAIETDLRLAVNAVRYAEEEQSVSVMRLLEVLIARTSGGDPNHIFSLSLRHLPVGPEHVEPLKELLVSGNSIAGEAVRLITQVLGGSFKSELFNLLEAHANDYNFAANGIVPALRTLIQESDLPKVIGIAKIWLAKEDDENLSAISDVLACFEPELLMETVKRVDGKTPFNMVSILGAALCKREDDKSFALLAELLLAHPKKVTSSFCLALPSKTDEQGSQRYLGLDHRHVEAIWSARFKEVLWDSALSRLCQLRPDLKAHTEKLADTHQGIDAIALRYCVGTNNEKLFAALEQLLALDDATLRDQTFGYFNLRKLDWRGHETLLVKSLVRNVPRLRKGLLDSEEFNSPALASRCIGLAEMQPVIELVDSKVGNVKDSWWQNRQLATMVARLGDAEVQAFCLNALVDGSKRLRRWIKGNYIGAVKDFTSDMLDDNMIAALLADLEVPNQISEYWYNPLGYIATDRFVQERLLPLARGSSVTFRDNLVLVLKTAGDRHGKRYRLPT